MYRIGKIINFIRTCARENKIDYGVSELIIEFFERVDDNISRNRNDILKLEERMDKLEKNDN